jgi:hypothetical protein
MPKAALGLSESRESNRERSPQLGKETSDLKMILVHGSFLVSPKNNAFRV